MCTRLADNISGTRLRAHTSQVGLDHSPRNHRQNRAKDPGITSGTRSTDMSITGAARP